MREKIEKLVAFARAFPAFGGGEGDSQDGGAKGDAPESDPLLRDVAEALLPEAEVYLLS